MRQRRTVEVTFDGTLWNAIPQHLKNRYGHCTGHWFRDPKWGVMTFVAQVPEGDVRDFTRDILAFVQHEETKPCPEEKGDAEVLDV